MRYLILSLFAFLLPVSHLSAAPAVTPDSVSTLAREGAPQLALSMSKNAQARSADRTQWLAWESLQWDLLLQLQRWDELQKRVRELPADASDGMRQQAQWRDVQAAVALRQDAAEARDSLAGMLWQDDLDPAQIREARRLVAETYFSQGRGEEAYLSVLRFMQDFSPLNKFEASGFAQDLVKLGKAADALALVPSLGDGPLAGMVRLRAGTLKPPMANAQARASLEKGGDAGYWAVLAEASELQRDTATQVEALEKLLAAQNEDFPVLLRTTPAQLSQAYSSHGLSVGNRHHLLLGDDGAWLALAAQLELESPLDSRALLGHLARQAKDESVRARAGNRLAWQLLRGGLERTVNAVFVGRTDLVDMLAADAERLDNPVLRREALSQVGGLLRSRGEFAGAAEYQLRSAGNATDDAARLARWRAAENLTLAGFREDARNQYRKLLEMESDPGRRQALRGVLEGQP